MLPGSGEALINYYYTKNQVGHSSIPLTGSAEGLRRVGRMCLGRALFRIALANRVPLTDWALQTVRLLGCLSTH